MPFICSLGQFRGHISISKSILGPAKHQISPHPLNTTPFPPQHPLRHTLILNSSHVLLSFVYRLLILLLLIRSPLFSFAG
jgi:hypothetical protein